MPFDGTSLNETAAHLLRAKQYIEEHGWSHKGPGIPGGPRCPVAAIYDSSIEDHRFRLEPLKIFERAISLSTTYGIGNWSDTPGRTIEEVYAAFDAAIALAMAEAV